MGIEWGDGADGLVSGNRTIEALRSPAIQAAALLEQSGLVTD